MTDLNDIIRDTGSTLIRVLDNLEITAVEANLTRVEQQINSLAVEVDSFRADLTADINDLRTRVDEASNANININIRLQSLDSAVNSNSFEIDLLRTKSDALDIVVQQLRNDLLALTSRVIALEAIPPSVTYDPRLRGRTWYHVVHSGTNATLITGEIYFDTSHEFLRFTAKYNPQYRNMGQYVVSMRILPYNTPAIGNLTTGIPGSVYPGVIWYSRFDTWFENSLETMYITQL